MTTKPGPYQLPDDWLDIFWGVLDPTWLSGQFQRYEDFRARFGCASRWWHRPPKMSPIVPLFYWPFIGLRDLPDEPMGVWRGDPEKALGRLLGRIMEFIDYWDSLPNGRGRTNLRYMLRSPSRFFAFLHEVRLATHIKLSGYHVEPLFFDPRSDKGSPDLIVRDGDLSYDVQCKALNPSEATDLPYDLFQFLAGVFARLVEESGRSYFLFLHLKKKLDVKAAYSLCGELRELVTPGLTTSGRFESDIWQVQLVELGYGPGEVTVETARQMALNSPGDPLYIEVADLSATGASDSAPRVSGCFVSGERRRGLEHFVFSEAQSAAADHTGDNPLIVSVSAYQETDMSAYLNGPSVGQVFRDWTARFFARHPQTALLLISANYQRYLELEGGDTALGTKYLVVESPQWEAVLPHLGVS